MSFDEIPLSTAIINRPGWKRTEGFSGFPVPIQPHFRDEFPLLGGPEFNMLIGYQLWWINAPAFAREEMRMRQTIFGPSAWTRFRPQTLRFDADPEQFAAAIRMALRTGKPESIEWPWDDACFAVTPKTVEVASTISDLLADIHAAIPAQIEDQKTLIRFIMEDRANNPMADANYRQTDLDKARRKIESLVDKMNGKGGSNWITPFDQRFTNPDSFK